MSRMRREGRKMRGEKDKSGNGEWRGKKE